MNHPAAQPVASAGFPSAKINGDEYWEMLQVLLEDRFKLAWRREIREAQVFALVVWPTGPHGQHRPRDIALRGPLGRRHNSKRGIRYD